MKKNNNIRSVIENEQYLGDLFDIVFTESLVHVKQLDMDISQAESLARKAIDAVRLRRGWRIE
jgi:hypothetical protein